MKNKSLLSGKLLTAAFTATVFSVLICITAFAAKEEKNYEILDCGWRLTESAIVAEWEKPESSTGFDVTLYKANSSGVNKKIETVSSSSNSHDFTDTILSLGSGNYQFRVKAKKGKMADAKYSDMLEIDNSYISRAKKAVKAIRKKEDPFYDRSYTKDGQIKSVVVKESEGDVPDGQIRQLIVTSANFCNVVSTSIDLPYEQWTVGVPRTLTLVLQAKDGLRFTDETVFTGKLLTYVSDSGDERNRTVIFTFTPRIKLEQISGLYVDESDNLHWNPVKNATYYKVIIKDGYDETIFSEKVKKVKLDISEYIDDIFRLQIYAGTKTPGYEKSETLKIEDFPYFLESGGKLDGEIVKTGKTYSYQTEEGEYLTGWQQLAGNWYFFDENGKAVGPGWWQDKVTPDDPNRAKGGSWYYFDKNHRMLANTTTPDGCKLDENGRWIQ